MKGGKISQATFELLLKKQAEGKTTDSENLYIDQIWEEISSYSQDFQWDAEGIEEVKARIQTKIDVRIESLSASRRVPGTRYFLRAAVLLLFLSLGLVVYNFPDQSVQSPIAILEKQTGAGQRAKITLSDGTSVHLNVNSILKYPDKFDASFRKVELIGEAFFEVSHDAQRPFIVETKELSTKVLGTSFNINSYPEATEEISVVSGKVQVGLISDGNKHVLLTPNQGVRFNSSDNQLMKTDIDAGSEIKWRSGELKFERMTFSEVIAELERYYHTPLIINNNAGKNCSITATFDNKGLQFILSSLQLLADFSYEKDADGGYVINYKNCGKAL